MSKNNNDIKRLNYFNGQLLDDNDFRDEQTYHIDMRRRLNQLLYNPGVVKGLVVTKSSDKTIIVSSGFAIDVYGCEVITLADSPPLDVNGANTSIYVTISYSQPLLDEDKRSKDNIPGVIRFTERPIIKASSDKAPTGASAGQDIILAKVKLDANGVITGSIDTSERQLANLRICNGKLGIGTTTDPKFALSVAGAVAIGTNFANLAVTDNSLNVEGNIIGKNLSLAADNEKRGALFFTLPGLYNHAVYNNNSDVDGEGKWDGVKFNTGAGINIRTGSPQNYVSSLYIMGGPLVGINTTDPKSHLSVAGGLSVGGTYAKTNPAPANGLLVEGKVGIGTHSPGEMLEIKSGKLQLDGNQQIKFTDTDITNSLKLQLYTGYGLGINAGTLFYAANGNHSWRDNTGTNERMLLTTGTDGGLTVKGTGNSSFAGKLGIGTTSPASKLTVAATVQTAESNITTSVANNGITIESTYVKDNFLPGLIWKTTDNNDTKPKAGIWLSEHDNGTKLYLGTSNAYATGITNKALTIDQSGNVGIGASSPDSKLHIDKGRVDITSSDNTGGGQNRFNGLYDRTTNGRSQLVLSSNYSDLVIASSQVNNNHGSTLTFVTYNTDNTKPTEFRKWVINQGNWGNRKQFLDFGFKDADDVKNPHECISAADTALTLDGVNKRVGICTQNPMGRLDIAEPPQPGTGSIASSSGTTVNGNTQTVFNTQLRVGDQITVGGQTKTVETITSNTVLTVNSAFSPAINSASAFTYVRKVLIGDGNVRILGSNVLEFGAMLPKEVSAGKIGYQVFTKDALDIVGAGVSSTERKIKLWAEGGVTLTGKLTLAEGIAIKKFSNDNSLSGNSDETVPTEKAIKAYIDSEISKLVNTFNNHYHEYGHHIYRHVANVAEFHKDGTSKPKQATN